MKYDAIKNPNYVATIIKVAALEDLEGLDNLKALRVFGMQALVSKDVNVGDVGVLFSTETQLSLDFASKNNLHRHSFDWERGIIDLWDTHSRGKRQSAILIDRTTLGVNASLAPTSDTDKRSQTERGQLEPDSGVKTTPKGTASSRTVTESSTLTTSASVELLSAPKNAEQSPASTTSPSTASHPSGTTRDTLNFEDAVNYVRSGGKFSSWITTTIPGLSGVSSAGGATWLSVGWAILSQVFSELSLTSAEVQSFKDKYALNANPTVTGYLEDSRRVKAIKLRGHRSDSLFMPLTAFNYLGVKPSDFQVGDVFDSINGKEIVRKYMLKEPKDSTGPKAKVRRVDEKEFPLHIDSENYWRNEHKIPVDAPVVITQKLHGTSVRYGNVPVAREKGFFEKLINKLGVQTPDTEHKFVVGSRMVVKSIDFDAESAGKNHFYAEDLWSAFAKSRKLDELIPEGFIVYGELIGWTPDGKPIQRNYTYNLKPSEAELYVYRVATVVGGVTIDLSWPQVKTFAASIGLKTVPELYTMSREMFSYEVDHLMDHRYFDEWTVDLFKFTERPVPLSYLLTVDEGVCVRYDGPNGIYILKAKAPLFLAHESKMLDVGAEDTEASNDE